VTYVVEWWQRTAATPWQRQQKRITEDQARILRAEWYGKMGKTNVPLIRGILGLNLCDYFWLVRIRRE
jgi:hypothetical protein